MYDGHCRIWICVLLLELNANVALLLPHLFNNGSNLVGLLVEHDDGLSDLVEHKQILVTDLTVNLLHAIVFFLFLICVVVLVSSKDTRTTLEGHPALLHHLAMVLGLSSMAMASLMPAHPV